MRKYKRKKNRYRPNKVYPIKDMLRMMINEELRPYNKTIEDVEDIGNFYNLYTFKTRSQERVWEEYCNRLIRRHLYSWYIDKREARKIISWVIFQYGLKAEYLDYEN